MTGLLVASLLMTQAIGLRVEVAPLGSGGAGTVVGIAFQIAPEDRSRVGDRVEVAITLVKEGSVVDRSRAVVALEGDGSALLYREWPAGKYELRVAVASMEGQERGGWQGEVEVVEGLPPFEPPGEAPADARALAVTAPVEGSVRFRPPPRSATIGAVQLEVEAPEGTVGVEFFQDDVQVVRRNRPPWTVSVDLGEIARRTTIRAVAWGAGDRFVGEDALVLNGPGSQLQVSILLGPQGPGRVGERVVTVAVGGGEVEEVVLSVDSEAAYRWVECPCVAHIPETRLVSARLLTAEARGAGGLRGEAVWVLEGAGFIEEVRVDQVELPVVVLDRQGRPVSGLGREAFRVFEDGQEMAIDSFGTTADLPLSLGLLVDTSGSMTETFAAVREAVEGFAGRLLQPEDNVYVMTFSWEPHLEVTWTKDARLVGTSLERIVPDGGTSLHDAVVQALELFRSRRGRTALVVLTDGDDTTSRTQWATAERFCRTARTPIFPIGFRISSLAFFVRGRLQDLAEATGGQVFYARKSENLNEAYAGISEQLRAQYLISYRSPSKEGADHFRQVRVEVVREGVTARTIAGYFPGW